LTVFGPAFREMALQVKEGGRGWVRTSDPPLVRRVLFH
jgi:hypothetical protein